MQGLFKRKGSDIYQGRFRIPSPLWRERNRLIGLGVKDIPKTQEHGRSTGKSDRDEAGEAYRAMLVAWDAKMAAWEKVLADGPMPLTPKQQMALAADHARAFVAAYDEDPYSAPPSPPVPQPSLGDDAHWIAMAEKMPPSERQRFMRDLRAYLKSQDEKRRSSLAFKLLDRYPDIRPFIAPHLASLLEAAHGDDTDKAVASKALHIDAEARRLVNLEMLSFMGAAHRGLEAKRGGNYNPVPELEAAPAFVPPAKTSTASSKADPQFTFRSIVAAETARRALGKDAKPFPASTPRKYLKRGEEFASWRQSQGLSKSAALDARTVTREEVERWRASLLAGSELTNRTINDKVSCISTIIKWGRRLHREAFHPEGNPLAGLEKCIHPRWAAGLGISRVVA
ncbi:hypothetical protein GCM10011385_40350 [Nitratireductor aestuarii]|uniref:Core-binding (CB) domain-containing protein n=2 Tax=Nitratireductor aestuarii TaxID=1735103 RepID=A0A916S490_9HYPH|nr:hypothetical protein GCM10011385_40350 [Nitratireductor aestuarii]